MLRPELEAVILCGGLGTRLQPIVSDRPKSMAVVRGRPFLEWLLLALVARGVRRVVLATGHRGNIIGEHLGDGQRLGLDLAYSRESQPLGTAGSMRLAASCTSTSPLLVMNGDSFCAFDLESMLRMHVTRGALATIWLQDVELTDRFGSVQVAEDGQVLGFREKVAAARGLVSAGVYLLERKVVESIPPGRNASLELDVFPSLAGRGLYALAGHGVFLDIGTPESYEQAAYILNAELDHLEETAWTSV